MTTKIRANTNKEIHYKENKNVHHTCSCCTCVSGTLFIYLTIFKQHIITIRNV